jgi:photosystem II PsbU protein
VGWNAVLVTAKEIMTGMKRLARLVVSVALAISLLTGLFIDRPVLAAPLAGETSLLAVEASSLRNASDEQRLKAAGKIDLNNTVLRAFQDFPGMYPGLARKIVLGGPYNSVEDVLSLDLTDRQKEIFNKYKDNFTVTDPVDALNEGDDRINSGIYR